MSKMLALEGTRRELFEYRHHLEIATYLLTENRAGKYRFRGVTRYCVTHSTLESISD